MKTLFAAALVLAPGLGWGQSRVEDWQFKEQETIQKTFNVAPGSKLLIDNVNGYIHVTGTAGGALQATVEKRACAASSDRLLAARQEVKLEVSQEGGLVRFYVDGPFRNKDGGVSDNGARSRGYRVDYDFEVQLPPGVELALKTLNSPIEVKKTTGNFDIHGLNGPLTMEDVAGSGIAQTLNGPVKVTFTRNPDRDSEFKTLNGAVDVYFQPGLNAEVHYKTLNGGVYSDFDVTPLAQPQSGGGSGNARFVYKSNREGTARIGSGGPKLTFDTLNGAIRLHSKTL